MCRFCEPLVKAIDAYLLKADDDLTEQLAEQGYAGSKQTAKDISSVEGEVEAALNAETEYITSELESADDMDDFMRRWESIKEGDPLDTLIEDTLRKQFEKCIPQYAQMYIEQTDRSLRLTQVTARTTAWMKSWSGQLGQLMKLNSTAEIEKILVQGLQEGCGINQTAIRIRESGIRDPYYKARRVALTETLRAHSVAQQEAFTQSPSVESKKWMHTGAYRNTPRPNHIDMNGQIVPKNERFTLRGIKGGMHSPMYPRDSVLPVEEVVNCHCICQPVVNQDILGLSLEERQQLQQEAIAADDGEWEKELDAQNRARAGIE